jgi:hypothetical protein
MHEWTNLEAVSCMRPVQQVHEATIELLGDLPCGGGVEYLHRDPASRRRKRKASLEAETVKYGHESQGTRTRERLRWRGPAAYTNDRPILTLERMLYKDKNKTVTVKE